MTKDRLPHLLYASIGIATLTSVIGFVLSPYPMMSVGIAILWILWTIALRQERQWGKNAGLYLIVLISVLAAWLGLNRYLLLFNIIFTMISWDISTFITNLNRTENIPKEKKLINAHISRLAIVSTLAFVLAISSFLLEFNISFGWALVLGLILIIALSRTIGLVRQS